MSDLCALCKGYQSDGADYSNKRDSGSECSVCDGSECECRDCDCSDWDSGSGSEYSSESEHECSSGDEYKFPSDEEPPGSESEIEPEENAESGKEKDKNVGGNDSDGYIRSNRYRRRWSRRNNTDDNGNDRTNQHQQFDNIRPRRYRKRSDDNGENKNDSNVDPTDASFKNSDNSADTEKSKNLVAKSDNTNDKTKERENNPASRDRQDLKSDEQQMKGAAANTASSDESSTEDENKYPKEVQEFLMKKIATKSMAYQYKSRDKGWRQGNRRKWEGQPRHRRQRRHLYSNITMPTGKKFWVSIPAAENLPWNCGSKTKLITLRPNGKMGKREYTIIAKEMENTRRNHVSGAFSKYEIVKVQKIVNPCLWKRYRHRRKDVMREGPANEQLLFHGSPAFKDLIQKGFDERYASKNGMFGAGLYFAKNSSKSNQYAFGLNGGTGCPTHKVKHCFQCERVLILCRVTLGKVQQYTTAQRLAHAPVGYHSVEGLPSVGGLQYSENIVYRGEQVYPEFLITYKLKP